MLNGNAGAPGRAGQLDGARCVALTQSRRGHGVSVMSYYLGRMLVERGLRVLLVDLTGRRERVRALLEREPIKNLGLWVPPTTRPEALPTLLRRARQETLGKVDVFLLDVDAPLLQKMGGLSAGVDYVVVFVETGATGLHDADQLGAQFDETPAPYGRLGVALCRTDASSEDELPMQTPERRYPVLGGFPADYLLAASDEYTQSDDTAMAPHDDYLIANRRLARALAEIVPLRRINSPAGSGAPA